VKEWKRQWRIAIFEMDSEYEEEFCRTSLYVEKVLEEFGENLICLGQ
jgi:hypothetical protein